MGLYSVPLIFGRLNFQMRISRGELAQGEELLFLQVVLIEQVKKYEFRIYLIYQKIKKLKKSLHYSLH